MSALSTVYKCDVIKTLLGYLYFSIAIYLRPVKSLDFDSSWEIKDRYFGMENCTQCNAKMKTCVCWENYLNKCVVCCSGSSCCTCYDCTPCWEDQRRIITMTQISISILFGCGLIGLIIIYCKICNRTRRRDTPTRCIMFQDESDTHCSTIEGLRERPPPYNEVYSAPPLYTSPYNRASMQEAPPSYPGTPKLQERSQDTTNGQLSRHSVFVASSIAQHM